MTNELRGPGYFGIDAGLDKDWKIREGQTLSFAGEAFNIPNAVRFDAGASSNNFDLTSANKLRRLQFDAHTAARDAVHAAVQLLRSDLWSGDITLSQG
jgi:hypothetical protein